MATSPTPVRALFTFANGEGGSWEVVNDGVMGGNSRGRVAVEGGALAFTGTLVTEGGGFSQVRTDTPLDLSGHAGLELRVRGGGRTFGVNVRDDARYRGRPVSRRASFPTTATWDTVRIPFDALESSVFGRAVDVEPINLARVRSLGFIIADGRDGAFRLEVDAVGVY